MELKDLSICFSTNKVGVCRDFYVKYFSGNVTFDCGWYVTVLLGGNPQTPLCFMQPQDASPTFDEKGVTLNVLVADVDAEYKRFVDEGLAIAQPIADQPWGDRSFRLLDPIGNTLYVYSERPMSAEYAECVK